MKQEFLQSDLQVVNKKIPHTVDTESLDRHEEKKNLMRGFFIIFFAV